MRLFYFVATISTLLVFAVPSAHAQFTVNDDGQFVVRAFNIVDGGGFDGDLNNINPETSAIWSFLDANPGFTGSTVVAVGGGVRNIQNNLTALSGSFTTPNVINFHPGNTGDFNAGNGNPDNPYSDIAGGAGTAGDDFSVRAQTYITFGAAGTYSIAAASDDGRVVNLTEAFTGSAPGYSGFQTAGGGQQNLFTGAGSTVMGFNDDSGHNNSTATFTVAAGDILALDAFFYERGGGDSFEISIKAGADLGFGGTGDGWALLTDNMFNGAIQLSSAIQAVPEPATIGAWSLIGISLVGFVAYRARRRK